MAQIDEQMAWQVWQATPNLSEERKQKAASILSDYRKQQETAGLPLWPAQEKSKQDRRQRMQAAFDNPLELDKEDGSFIQADRIQTGLGDTLRKREASILWLADKYQVDENEVRGRLDFYKADASEKWGSGLLDDSAFFAKAKGEVTKQKELEGIQQDAFTMATQAAWSSKPMLSALNEWQGMDLGPQEKTKLEQTPVFMRAYREAAEKQRPYRGVIADVVKMARSMDDNPDGFQFSEMADRLLIVPPQDRALVLEAIANSAPKPEEGRAVLQRLAMSMDRGLDRLVDTGITGFVGKAMSDLEQSAQTSPFVTPEQSKELVGAASQVQDYLDLRDDMREIASGQLSPLKDVRFMGANFSGVAENLPMTISSFAPYIGPALLVGSMQRDTANSLRRDYLGMSRADRESVAAWSAPFQAATEVISDRLLLGRLPNLRRVFSSPALSARGIAGQFTKRAGLNYATETAEEFLQGVTPMLVMEAQQALQKDVPDANWGRFFEGFGNNFGELSAVILPMALIGAGAGQLSDFSNARDLAQDERALIAAKYSPEGAAKIAEAAKAGDWQTAQDLMRADWKTVNAKAEPLSEVASRAFTKASTEIAAEVQQGKSEAAQALEQSATKGIFPRIRADTNGWAVEDLDTGSMVRVGSRAEAVELAYSGMSDKERQSAESMAQMADEFLGDRSRPEAFEITKNEQRLEDEVKAGRVTQEQVREAAQLYGQMHGLTAEESKIELLEVFGNNVPEENERVREYVSRIHGGGNLITVIHEGVHGRWNAGLKSKHYSHEQGLMWVRMAEQASGVKFLPVSDDAEVSPAMLDEAMAEMVSADVIGRRKDDKKHFSPGLISRGISAFALGEREVVLGEGKRVASGKSWVTSDGRVIEGKKWAGKFAVFLKSWKGFWGKVLRNAKALQRARKEGKIGEDFDAFLDDLLGAEPQVRYEAQAVREVADMVSEVDNAPFSLRAVPTSEIQTIPEDLERARADAERAGPGWAASVDLSEPVGVYRDKEGNLKLFDGHHRWLAADTLGEPLQVRESVFESAPFSLGPRSLAAVADTVMASKMRSSKFREGYYTEARRLMAKLWNDGEWRVNKRGIASRRVGFDSRMAGVRDPANIEAERKFRFRSRQRELIDAGMLALTPETLAAYDAGLMALDDSPLVSAMLNDNGKLMSKTTAQKLGKLKTDGKGNAGDYDSAPRLPAGWYGKDSGIMPDVMAQALYEQGLLKDAYPDTLWEALRSAINSTKAANAAFDKARAAVRKVETDAAAHARKESDQWAKDETAKIPTQKERQMMALRTLDAILSAFPPEVRGRVGGFVKLASLNTDKAREAEIERRLLKLDDVVESEARKYYAAKIEKLFKKAAPKREGGKKPTGKLGADIQGLLDLAEKFSNLDEAGVTGERSAIADAMQKNERNADKLAELFEREQLLDVFGGIYERTAAEMESAAAWLDGTYSAGRNAWKAVIEARQEEAKQAREEAQTDIGKEGLDEEQLEAMEQAKTVTGKLKNFGLSFMSFEQVMQSALGRGSELGRSFVNLARKATNQKTDALRQKRKAFRDSMASIFGTPKQSQWQQRLYELSQITDPSAVTVTKMEGAGTKTVEIPAEIVERIIMGDADAKAYGLDALTIDALESQWNQNEALPGNRKKGNLSYDVPVAGKATKTTISQLQAVHVTMMARQASYTENMARHGWDADVLKDIESKLTPQAKAIRDFLSNEYRAGYYPLNAVFSRMYGLNLPQLTNYAPGTFEAMDAMGQGIDPYGQGLLSEGGFKAGMLKTRQKHQAKPRLEDALAVYWGHVNATEHFKAFGEFARDIRSVMNYAEVRGSITAKGGESLLEAVQNWITAFERNGVENRGTSSAFNEFIRKRQSSQAYISLAYNVGTLWKQSTASFAAMLDMGPMDAMRVFAKFLSGQLELGESYRSDVIQRRLDAGYSPEVRQAMAGMMAEKPSWASPFVQKGMEIIGLVDAMFTTASHAMAYDHHLTQAKAAGLNDAQAKLFATREAEATVARTAQPSEMMDRSLNEIGMQPLAKFMFMFATEARQKAALAWDAYSLNSGLTKGERATRLLLLHVIFPVIIQTITNAWRDARDDGEDDEMFDEKNWQAADYARAMIFGPLLGVPLVGNALNSFSSQSPWSQFSGGILGVMKAIEDDDLEGGLKAAKTVIRTAAIVAGGEKAAAAGISAGVLFDAYRVIGNVTED